MENRKYLILGASSDIGIAYLRDLNRQLSQKKESAMVVAHFGLHADKLQEWKEELTSLDVLLIGADLGMEEGIQSVLEFTEKHCGCPDYILHLPASKLTYQKLKKFDWNVVSQDLNIQVRSFAEIGKAFFPRMAKQGFGRAVVMLSSCTLGMPPGFLSQYVTVKYALLGLMKAVAVEYGGKGVSINGISPNMIETKFLQGIDERIVEMNRENCLQKRNVRVEEVVAAIRYLFSEEAAYMNGVNLNLTGGDCS